MRFRGAAFPFAFRRRTAAEPPSARSSKRRFGFIVAIFATIQAIILGLALIAVESIDATRAYIAGEGTYSASQKQAALHIRRFIARGDPAILDEYRQAIAVPIGDREAREALERRPRDLARAYAGFLKGDNDPQDIPGMIRLFIWLSWWRPYALAVEDWRRGDALVTELAGIGEAVAAARLSDNWNAQRRDAFYERVNDVDERLTQLESSFSQHMGEAARAARDLVVIGLLLSSAVLWAIGIRLSWQTFRSGLLAEQRLARSEQRFRDFAEVASDWFWETDSAHRVSYISGGATSRSYRPKDFLGRTLIEIARGDAKDAHWSRHLADLAAHRPFRDFAFSLAGADGAERFWSVSGIPMHDDLGRFIGYRGTGTEITREVQAQRHLERAKEQAETASRAKSEFLANMSHELRTPLNAILGFAEIIRDRLLGPIGDARYAEYAQDIHSSGTHLLGIINDILDLSKVEAGRLELVEEIVDIQSIVKSVVLLLRERVATAGLQLKIDLPDNLLLLRADERKLKQVLMNLLSNAVKFTPSGGEIAIRVRVGEQGMILEVRDNGIGIAPEDIERALSPFGQVDSRLSRRYEGTGLGLPLARALVELHGGTLSLESMPGRGTTVRITLPGERLVEREMRRWIAS
jgi:PAS domain S-box-containing protein